MISIWRTVVGFIRRRPRLIAAACILLLLVALQVIVRSVWPTIDADVNYPLRAGPFEVLRITAGNEFVVQQKQASPTPTASRFTTNPVRLRLLGVKVGDMERDEPFAEEARAFSSRFLSQGEPRLEFDKHRVDRRGWFLAYVWVNDRLLNEELLRVGLGRYSLPPGSSPRMARRLKTAQREAQEARQGVWAVATGKASD